MGETELSPESGSPEQAGLGWGIVEGLWEPRRLLTARGFREGFLEEGMVELCCEGPG